MFRSAADEQRFTDDDILTVIHAGESGVKLAELCEATGISLETYYEWKTRYRGMTAAQVHALRASARSRRRGAAMLVCAAGAAALFTAGSMLARRSDASAVVPTPGVPSVATMAPGTPGSDAATRAAATGAPAPRTTEATRVADPRVTEPRADTTSSTRETGEPSHPSAGDVEMSVPARSVAAAGAAAGPSGFSVQVSATPNLQEARLALEKLAAAGYSAYLTTKTIKGAVIYRVRVGPIESREAAGETAERLTGDGYVSPWVTR